MNHREMTKHIRGRIKADKIAARVWLCDGIGGAKCINIYPAPVNGSLSGVGFTADEARKIAICGKANGLTYVQGIEIDDSIARWDGSGATNFVFYYHG